MFDIGATELLLIVVVALLVIGPKDLPRAMRTVGHWMGKAREVTRHFRTGIDAMIREAELEEQHKKWAGENERIMREHPPVTTVDTAPSTSAGPPSEQPAATDIAEEPGPLNDNPPEPPVSPSKPHEFAEPEFGLNSEPTRPKDASV